MEAKRSRESEGLREARREVNEAKQNEVKGDRQRGKTKAGEQSQKCLNLGELQDVNGGEGEDNLLLKNKGAK